MEPSTEGQDLTGKVLAEDFRVLRRIGIGAFTKVYLAVQESVPQRKVAIRVLHEIYLRKDPKAPNKLKREAYFMGQLKSPCFPRVFMTGITFDGLPFIAMELIEGPTVEAEIKKRKRLPLDMAIDLSIQLLEGIEEMHSRGILHRDIKPGNLALETTPSGRMYLKILDLGNAIAIEDAGPQFKDGKPIIVGTPAYVAPEQFINGITSVQTDIYQLSCTIYEMLTGTKAVRVKRKDLEGYREYLMADNPVPTYPIGDLRPDVPPDLELVIEKGLAKDPKHRWPSVKKMLHAFVEALGDPSSFKKSSGFLNTLRKLFGR